MSRMTLEEYCAQNRREELLAQWDTERNAPLTPQDVTAGSSRKFWWKDAHGHRWSQSVEERTGRGKGCPYCANRTVLPGFNDLATTHPELAAQWDGEKNGALTPQQVLAGSQKKV